VGDPVGWRNIHELGRSEYFEDLQSSAGERP
jgi:hypothetical protein